MLPSDALRTELKIPSLQLKGGSASDCNISEQRRSSVLAYINQAEDALAKSAKIYDNAIQSAGLSMPSQFYGRGIISRRAQGLFGPMADNSGTRSGAKQMQEVENQLQLLASAIMAIDKELGGLARLQAPRQPLAMTALLQLLSSGNVSLELCNHPVIMALYQNEMAREATAWQQMGGYPGSYQQMGGYPASGAGGILGRRRYRRRGGAGILGRPCAHAALGGALGGGQQQEKAMARFLASNVCTADSREFQRLTQQLEQLRQWLMF